MSYGFRTTRLNDLTEGGREKVRRAGWRYDGGNEFFGTCTERDVNSESLDEKRRL